ncbi:MAG: hypothetical protein AAFO02_02005 [Bacteroidota bacterium]
MPSSKLIEVVSYLSKKQRRRLQQFVESPYFNHKSNACQLQELLEIVIKHDANPRSRALEKEHLQAHFFPNSSYSANTKNEIDSLSSALNKLVERFVAYEELEPELEKRLDYGLARFFATNGNVARFWSIIRKFRKDWDREDRHDSYDYLLRSRLEELAVSFAGSYDPNSKLSSLQAVDTYFDQGFFAKKMELAIILSYSKLYRLSSDSYANQFSEYVEGTYPKYQSVHTINAEIYHLALQVFHQPENDELFLRFERLICEQEHLIPLAEINNIQTFYRYFFGRHYKLSGNTELSSKLVVLYKEHLERGYFFHRGDKMHISTLKLLVNFGIKQKELEWVAHLLQLVPADKILGTKYPEEIYSLCQAELLFAQEEYQEAEAMITYRLFEDVNFSLSCDILLIKIYFATDHDLLESRIRAMELKVRRADIAEFDKKAYLHFISVMRQINKYKWLKDQDKLQEVKDRINSDTPLIQREWLLAIIAV